MNSLIKDILKKPETCALIDSGNIDDVMKLLKPHWSERDKEELYDIFSSCELFPYELLPVGVEKELINDTSLRLKNYDLVLNENQLSVIWRFYGEEEKDPEIQQFKTNLRKWIRNKFPKSKNISIKYAQYSGWNVRFRRTDYTDVVKLEMQKE